MIKKTFMSMLISFLFFSIFVSVRYFIKLNNELEQKKNRANCGINFNRLANLISQNSDNKTKKISDIIKSNDKIFIPISNIRFEDLLVVHHDLLRINIFLNYSRSKKCITNSIRLFCLLLQRRLD